MDKVSLLNSFLKELDNNNIDIKKTYLFSGDSIASAQFSIKKIKEDIKNNYKPPKKNIKAHYITIDIDKDSSKPIIISCTQTTITPNLTILNKEGDGSQNFYYTYNDIKKYGFKFDYIIKIIKSIKNKSVNLEKDSIPIKDIL